MFHHPMWDFLLPRNGRRCHLRNVGTLFVYKHTVLRVKRNWYLEFYGFSLILYKIWKFYDLKQKNQKRHNVRGPILAHANHVDGNVVQLLVGTGLNYNVGYSFLFFYHGELMVNNV